MEVGLSAETGSVGGELHLPFCLDRIPPFSQCVWVAAADSSALQGQAMALDCQSACLLDTGRHSFRALFGFCRLCLQSRPLFSLSSQAGRGAARSWNRCSPGSGCVQSPPHSQMMRCWPFLHTPSPWPLLLFSVFSSCASSKVMRVQTLSCQTEQSRQQAVFLRTNFPGAIFGSERQLGALAQCTGTLCLIRPSLLPSLIKTGRETLLALESAYSLFL